MACCIMCDYDPDAPVHARWEFSFDRPVKSLNDHLVNRGGARFEYKAERKAWTQWVGLAKVNQRITRANGVRRLVLTRVYADGQRRLDRDNLAGGMKPVVDGFTAHGLLVDDSEKWAKVYYRQVKGDKRNLVCLLEDLDP
jgi:hypothetical protein